jgi:hypothetical protein
MARCYTNKGFHCLHPITSSSRRLGCSGMKALSCAAVLAGPDRSFLVPVGISSGRWKIRHHLILRSKSKSRRIVVSVTPWCERSE